MQLIDRQQEIIDEFEFYDSWMDKYQYLIDLGKDLEPLDEAEKNETNLVRGCQSQVWIIVSGHSDNVEVRANSDAAIVSGLIALVVRLYSNASAEEIIRTEPKFVEAIGLSQHLSSTRANGLASMLQRLKADAAKLLTNS
ncbi:MAG: Fe-S metabolism protein SufE [Gammaproteobacteria bacterium]|nr:Fe-S metabolism protein SufE [Gammaproteobacteria bacterium]|tara:strand:+ start:555 stop:974 length:420 start_codon:yes stop_codon:yes gene_type:complete